MPWRFFDYITEDQENPFDIWYGQQVVDVKVECDLLIKALAETDDWDEARKRRRKYRELTRKHIGLCELVFNVPNPNRKFRLIGIRHLPIREFVLLGGCVRESRYSVIPATAFDDALKLKEHYDRRSGVLREHIV